MANEGPGFDPTNPPPGSEASAPGGPPSFAPPPLTGETVARPPRPATVTAAATLLIVIAALSIIGLVVVFASRNVMIDALRTMPKQAGAPSPETQANISVISGTIFTVIQVIAFAVLAMFVRRGSNVARIITWVVVGLFTCCSGGFGILAAFSKLSLPTWLVVYQDVGYAVSFLLYITVIVLLALPASNAYFRPKPTGQLY